MSEFDNILLVMSEGRSVASSLESDEISGDLRFFAPSLADCDLICEGVQLREPQEYDVDVLDEGDVDAIDVVDGVNEVEEGDVDIVDGVDDVNEVDEGVPLLMD
mmetsp:Transcript_455/g.872  ORF Transcript_455/g.872 Transcript_455/m.872 type:complete len:104 (-) Transcript_455:101-412(-)